MTAVPVVPLPVPATRIHHPSSLRPRAHAHAHGQQLVHHLDPAISPATKASRLPECDVGESAEQASPGGRIREQSPSHARAVAGLGLGLSLREGSDSEQAAGHQLGHVGAVLDADRQTRARPRAPRAPADPLPPTPPARARRTGAPLSRNGPTPPVPLSSCRMGTGARLW